MFFIGIFGVEEKQKEIRTIENLSCKNCESSSNLVLLKQYTFFHLFFIPIFKWDIRYYLMCNKCNAVYELSKEKGIRTEQGEDNAITYWDLNRIETSNYGNYRYNTNRCENCRREIEPHFEYCPHCGKRQY